MKHHMLARQSWKVLQKIQVLDNQIQNYETIKLKEERTNDKSWSGHFQKENRTKEIPCVCVTVFKLNEISLSCSMSKR